MGGMLPAVAVVAVAVVAGCGRACIFPHFRPIVFQGRCSFFARSLFLEVAPKIVLLGTPIFFVEHHCPCGAVLANALGGSDVGECF